MLDEAHLKKLNAVRWKALAVGVAAVAITLGIGVLTSLLSEKSGLDKIFQSFIISYILWLSMGVGCLALLMLHHLCGGGWSFLIQRITEAGTRTLPFFFVLGAIVLLGAVFTTNVYPWTDQSFLDNHHVVENKLAFLNKGAFTAGFLVYFGLWLGLMYFFNKWSRNLDETGDHKNVVYMKRLAAPGLLIYVTSLTLAATHWAMSLEPEWFSTIYGAWLLSAYALTVVSFGAIALTYIAELPDVKKLVRTKHFHHLGNFMLGFTIFWSYISFSQYLIIWSGNIPEESGWYLHRTGGGLTVLTVLLMVFHWFLPMMVLLMRKQKTDVAKLRRIAYYILSVRILDVYWNIAPSFVDQHNRIDPLTVVCVFFAVVGVGGLWLWVYLGQLAKRPILPQRDPREAILFVQEEAHGHA